MAEKKSKVLKEAREEVTYLTGDEEIKRLAELREKWEMERIWDEDLARKEGIEERRKTRKEKNSQRNVKKWSRYKIHTKMHRVN